MAIEWTANLAVGIPRIDEQHKILYRKVDDLFKACQQGQGKSVIGDTLKFLKDYTKLHFKEEEQYMKSINYPDYIRHSGYHQSFIAEIDKLIQEHEKTNNALLVTLSVNSLMVKWLNQHISKEDKKIGEFASN